MPSPNFILTVSKDALGSYRESNPSSSGPTGHALGHIGFMLHIYTSLFFLFSLCSSLLSLLLFEWQRGFCYLLVRCLRVVCVRHLLIKPRVTFMKSVTPTFTTVVVSHFPPRIPGWTGPFCSQFFEFYLCLGGFFFSFALFIGLLLGQAREPGTFFLQSSYFFLFFFELLLQEVFFLVRFESSSPLHDTVHSCVRNKVPSASAPITTRNLGERVIVNACGKLSDGFQPPLLLCSGPLTL